MKKLLVVVAAVCLVGFATSCKKECKCTVDGKDVSAEGTIDSKEKCTEAQDAYNAGAKLAEEMGLPFPKMTCEWK